MQTTYERTRNRFDSLTHSTVNIIYLSISSKSLVPENEMEKLIIYFGGAYMIVCLRVLPCYTYSITRVLQSSVAWSYYSSQLVDYAYQWYSRVVILRSRILLSCMLAMDTSSIHIILQSNTTLRAPRVCNVIVLCPYSSRSNNMHTLVLVICIPSRRNNNNNSVCILRQQKYQFSMHIMHNIMHTLQYSQWYELVLEQYAYQLCIGARVCILYSISTTRVVV